MESFDDWSSSISLENFKGSQKKILSNLIKGKGTYEGQLSTYKGDIVGEGVFFLLAFNDLETMKLVKTTFYDQSEIPGTRHQKIKFRAKAILSCD